MPTFSAWRSGAARPPGRAPRATVLSPMWYRWLRARPPRAGPSSGDARARQPLELLSATDGRTHRVVERAYGDALLVRAGHCVAVCGHDVVLCALTAPPGPLCRRCAVLP